MSYGVGLRNGVAFALGTIPSLTSGGNIRPSLTLNFLSGTLDPSITFTRSTTATYYDSNGLLASSAINTPRFDYNPVTLALQGLLIEEQRTNLVLNSLITGTNLSTQTVTVTAVAHTLSFYGTGTITLSGVATAVLAGSGAYPTRSTLTFTPLAGALILTVTGTVQYAQLEIGAFVTSFIPTAGSSVLRTSDTPRITTLTPWYNQSQGSFIANVTPIGIPSGAANVRFLETNDGGSLNRKPLFFTAATGVASVQYRIGGADQAVLGSSAGIFAAGVNLRIGTAYAVNNFAASFNGATPVVDTAGSVSSTSTQLTIGYATSGGGAEVFSGHFRSLAYYSTRLSNAMLQRLTL